MSSDAGNSIEQPDCGVDSPPPFDHAGRKRSILYFLLGYSAFLGFIASFLAGDDPLLDLVLGLPLLLGGVYWCDVDAQQRGMRLGKIMRLSLVLLFAFAFPIYAFRSRGLAGLATILLALLFSGLLFGVIGAAEALMDVIVN